MDIKEYESVKDKTYLEYCDYLQDKYGISKYNYFSASFTKSKKVSRTKEGLVIHHKYEDHAIMLSTQEFAMANPYEWQLAENLVYCDYLEHLLLHILICEHPSPNANAKENVGFGGVVNFLVPELNDVYSGWKTKLQWQKNCHDRIINDKDVYMALIKRFKSYLYKEVNKIILQKVLTSSDEKDGLWKECKNKELLNELIKPHLLTTYENICKKFLLKSFNEQYGLWAKSKNEELFDEIMRL